MSPHLRHHLVGHESLDGCQTQLGDFWLFGAAAHQERLHDFGAVLLQRFRETRDIKTRETGQSFPGELKILAKEGNGRKDWRKCLDIDLNK